MSKKKLYAHILLDRSGSMEECRDSTISAFNEYVNTLRSDADISARVSLTLFDDQGIDLVFDRQKPRDMPKLTGDIFVPRGMTPLNERSPRPRRRSRRRIARGRKRRLRHPDRRMENASREYSRDAVRKLLARLQKEKNCGLSRRQPDALPRARHAARWRPTP